MANYAAIIAAVVCLSFAFALAQSKPDAPIDWQKAQQLNQRSQRGEKLSADEQAYLDRAKAEIAAGGGPGRNPAASRPAGTAPASRAGGATNPADLPVPPAKEKLGLVPLDQMTAKEVYKGQDGGLYGQGKNDPPAEQLKAAKAALAKVQPLDKDGKPAADGKVVLMSVGMSNTMEEFGIFKRSDGDKDRNAALVVVNGAIGGMTAQEWTKPQSRVWEEVQDRLAVAKVTDKQVQVVWLKQAIGGPGRLGDFESSASKLKEYLIGDIQQVLKHYPNVRIIYLSSRIYAGNATSPLNPEPYAYESAFAVRWVIQDQIKGSAELNFDAAKGEVKAPVLLWGPYLWADGVTPRKSDGLSYQPSDFNADGTHPGPSGGQKVAGLLEKFFKNDLNAGWYLKAGAQTRPPDQKGTQQGGAVGPAPKDRKGRVQMLSCSSWEEHMREFLSPFYLALKRTAILMSVRNRLVRPLPSLPDAKECLDLKPYHWKVRLSSKAMFLPFLKGCRASQFNVS